MPLDINLFRADSGGNPELIRESQRRRFASVELVDEIIAKDEKWRFLTGTIDNLRKKRNAVQKDVATKIKAKEPADALIAETKSIGEEILATETEQKALKVDIDRMVGTIGNLVDDSVPVGQDEDAGNIVVRKWGVPRDPTGTLNHHDLLWRIGGYEPERGAQIAGHRGYFLKDAGVLLNQAFINYGIAFLRKREYSVLQPPYMMKKDMMAGVAQLEQFDEELYKVSGGPDGEDKYLIATSEQPICGYHANEWLEEKTLPIRYSGVSTCFRKEAGKHGKDTWGIFRVHQFEKVEQFAIVEGDLETSNKMQEEMIQTAEEFYQSLGFPYHVINIVSGALNNAAIRKYDLECWFPGYNAYRELVSCSNCTDYQSRAMEIRCGMKKLGDREKKYVHMLNATLCATGRAICCLLETYQEADGVRIPEVLVPFMGGITFLPFVRDARPTDKSTAAGEKKKAEAGAKTDKPPKAEKPKVEKVAAAAVAPPAAAAAAAVETLPAEKTAEAAHKPNNVEKVTSAVNAVSHAVVDAANAAVAAVTAAVTPAPKAEKVKTEKAAPVPAAPKEDKSKPPAVPILPPKYTTPAPVTQASTSGATISAASVPSVQDLLTASTGAPAAWLSALDSRLQYYSYVAGFQPGAADLTLSAAVSALPSPGVDAAAQPNVARWMRSVQSFTAEERAQWA